MGSLVAWLPPDFEVDDDLAALLEEDAPEAEAKHLLGFHDQATHGRRWSIDDLLKRARAIEPQVTDDLQAVARVVGGDLVLLDKRLKTEDAIRARIERNRLAAAARGVKPDDVRAAKGVPDTLRYTVTFDEDAYTGGAIRLMKALNALGYRARFGGWGNAWGGPAYKGLNLRLVPPDAADEDAFELQIHTPASLAAKRGTHELYVAARSLPHGPERVELERQMRERSRRVPVPRGAYGLSWRGEVAP